MVDAMVAPAIRDGWLVGVSVVIVEGDVAEVFHYGGTTIGGPAPNDRSVYEIGSLTKVFTATLLADAVGRGELRLEQPVAALLPVGTTLPPGDPITLVGLATHTSGLPRLPPSMEKSEDMINPYADYTATQLYADLAATTRTQPPHGVEYSNFGMGLLGHAMTLPAGQTFEALLRARVLGPLQMTDTAVTRSPESMERSATPHLDRTPVPAWEWGVLVAMGGLWSTPADLRKFLQAHLDPGSPLAPTLRMTQEPRAGQGLFMDQIGLAWHLRPDGVVWHNGMTHGSASYLAFEPAQRRGLAVLSNTADPLIDEIGVALSLRLQGLPATVDLPKLVALTPAQLERCAGVYADAAGERVTVTLAQGRLRLEAPGYSKLQLWPVGANKFMVRMAMEVGVEFIDGADGRAGTVRFEIGPEVQTYARVAGSP